MAMQRDSEDEWQEWYRLTPMEPWRARMESWTQYVYPCGTLEPEPDDTNTFHFSELRG